MPRLPEERPSGRADRGSIDRAPCGLQAGLACLGMSISPGSDLKLVPEMQLEPGPCAAPLASARLSCAGLLTLWYGEAR